MSESPDNRPEILRPQARRPFELGPQSTESSMPPTPSPENANAELLEAKLNGLNPSQRSKSILNLTSSTLFGIYSPTGYDVSRDEPSTPWGTGAETPALRNGDSIPKTQRMTRPNYNRNVSYRQHGFKGYVVPLALRTVMLFAAGWLYGLLVTHLHNYHDDHQITPVKFEGARGSKFYFPAWGVAGVLLGTLLPAFDAFWKDQFSSQEEQEERPRSKSAVVGREDDSPAPGNESGLGAEWNPAVRSVGAFVGIAFAIRRLPWESTSQVSLTLALVNPAIWYLVDRSKTGFILATVTGIGGMLALLAISPNAIPLPSSTQTALRNLKMDELPSETIAIATWIASVLFCACVCFGNVGRRFSRAKVHREMSTL